MQVPPLSLADLKGTGLPETGFPDGSTVETATPGTLEPYPAYSLPAELAEIVHPAGGFSESASGPLSIEFTANGKSDEVITYAASELSQTDIFDQERISDQLTCLHSWPRPAILHW